MSNWVHATLQDICRPEKGSIISGPFGSNISSKFFVDEGVPVIRGNNLSLSLDKFYDDGFVFVTQEKADELNCYALEGDLLFTAAGTIGQVGILEAPLKYAKYVISNKQLRARIDTSKVDLLYAYYWFSSAWMQDYFIRNNKGSTVPLISLSELKDAPISYPEDISEQKRIVAEIEVLSQKIETNRSICAELESMAKTIYDYWFTQFDFPDADGNPYCSSGGTMEWNAQLKRKIPLGWKVAPLATVITGINTGLNPRDNFVLGKGDIQYLTVKNLTTAGTIDFSGCDTIDEEARAIIHRRSDISIGDILFASIAPLGRCYLIQSTPENWDINESVFSIRGNSEHVTPEFLYMYFMSDAFIKGATSSSTGSIFKGIRINTLLDMVAVIPPKHIAEAFSGQIKEILALKAQKSDENMELTKLRDWLLPMLMNGQATVE
jgi:type I restriction enzyme S subunit